jgi:Holliday junction resolvase RusA-like endonuclease
MPNPQPCMATFFKGSLSLVVPFPSAKLHAHNKGHWRSKVAAIKAIRRSVAIVIQQAEGFKPKPWPFARLTITFMVPDRRRRDTLNMMQSLKPVIDGVVDAGLIADDNWQTLCIQKPSVSLAEKPDQAFVELCFFKGKR